jgi:hypothetical protein
LRIWSNLLLRRPTLAHSRSTHELSIVSSLPKLFKFVGATVVGTVAGMVGAKVGIMTGVLASAVGTGVGIFIGGRLADHFDV